MGLDPLKPLAAIEATLNKYAFLVVTPCQANTALKDVPWYVLSTEWLA